MNLKERINEALQSLVEANINPSILKGAGWNDAYWEIRNDINPEGKDLYVIKIYNGGKEMPPKKIAAGRVQDSQTRYLKINMGSSPVSAPVGKQWMKKNIGTANFSFSYTPAEATKFAVNNVSELDDLTNQLQKRKARKELSYTNVTAELFEKGNKKENPDNTALDSNTNMSLEELLKGYINSLFTAIKGTEIGNKIPFDGDLSYSGTSEISGEATNFYNMLFTTSGNLDKSKCAAILEQDTNSPLWGNMALSIGAFLFYHGHTGDVISKARRLLRSMKDSSRAKTCSGISMALAANKNIIGFDNDEFAKTIQLIDNMLYIPSWTGIKNTRYTKAPEDLKRTVAYYIITDNSTLAANSEECELLRKYLLGEQEHLKFDNVANILPAGSDLEMSKKFNEVSLKSYKEIESNARTLLLKENEGSSAVFIRYKFGKDDWSSPFVLTWDGDGSNDIYTDLENTVTKNILSKVFGSNKKDDYKLPEKSYLYFSLVPDEKSKQYIKISSIESDMKDKTRVTTENQVAEVDISGMSRENLKELNISFEQKEDGNILYLNGTKNITGPEVETNDEETISNEESVDPVEAEEVGAAEEVSEEGVKEAKNLVQLGLLDEIEPDGTEKYIDPKFNVEMIRDCSVSRGDIIVGADGAYHTVLKRDIGNGKWNVKSGTKILRWKKDVVDKIGEMGFSLNPGNWGKTGVTRESLMTDLGYIRNDLND